MKLPMFALLIASASPAVSQPVAPPPVNVSATPDPAAVAAALKFLDVQHFDQQLLDSTEMFTEAFMAAAIQRQQEQNPDEAMPEAFLTDLRGTIREHAMSTMRNNMAELKRKTAEIYASQLSAAELTRIADLSADPAMQKLRHSEKLIQPQLVMVGMQLMQKHEPALKQKVEALVAKHLKTLDGNDSNS